MNKNKKLVVILSLLVLVSVIIFQNTEPVNLKILFWDFEASLILLLILVFLIGVIIGYFLVKTTDKHKKTARKNEL